MQTILRAKLDVEPLALLLPRIEESYHPEEVVCATSVIAGCRGDSCTLSRGVMGEPGASRSCVEYFWISDNEAIRLEESCVNTSRIDPAVTAQFAHVPCSRAGSIGGCDATRSGFTSVTWYYPFVGMSADYAQSVQTDCRRAMNAFWVTSDGEVIDGRR